MCCAACSTPSLANNFKFIRISTNNSYAYVRAAPPPPPPAAAETLCPPVRLSAHTHHISQTCGEQSVRPREEAACMCVRILMQAPIHDDREEWQRNRAGKGERKCERERDTDIRDQTGTPANLFGCIPASQPATFLPTNIQGRWTRPSRTHLSRTQAAAHRSLSFAGCEQASQLPLTPASTVI